MHQTGPKKIDGCGQAATIRPRSFLARRAVVDFNVGKIAGKVRLGLSLPILVALLAMPAIGKVHPVALDKDTKDSKCLECHEDKTKGKVVHKAVASGCYSCHELRLTKDTTRITLTAATAVKVCVTCHDDKDAAKIKGSIHSPNTRDCLKCHDPHTSDNDHLLVEADSGATKADNTCLQCHTTGMNVAAKGSRHAALDMGCATCHSIHKSGPSPEREFRDHLTKATPALCLDCHDPTDKDIAKAHNNQPIEKADCVTCHDPHQSKSPKLMQAFLHSPFESKSCDSCHDAPKDGKVVLVNKDVKAMCATCHDDVPKQIAGAKVQHPGAQGDCTDCHSPHAGKTPGFLRPDPVSACLGCHSDQETQIKKAHPHEPASVAGCATCHEAHGSANAKLLRGKTVNAACLECHGPDVTPVKVEEENVVTIFDGKVKLPIDYFRKVPGLPVKAGIGHPTENHPVQDVMDPANPGTVKTKLDCLSCHQPHGSAKQALLVKDSSDNIDFCKTCHANGLDLKSIKVSK